MLQATAGGCSLPDTSDRHILCHNQDGRLLMGRKVILAGLAALLSVGQAYADPPTLRKIVNLASGLRVDVIGASNAWLQGSFLWPNNASGSQTFDLVQPSNDDDSFNLMAEHSGQCLMLDWRDGSFHNGTRVVQFPHCRDPGYLPAQWHWGFVMDGCNPSWQQCGLERRMILVNKATHKCLDAGNAAGGTPPRGAVLQIWDCIGSIGQWNAGNQLWTMAWP
jgi:hypothetical protein